MTLTAVHQPRLVDELGELAVRMSTVLLGDDKGDSAVQILTSLSVNAVPYASGAGLTLVDPDGTMTSQAATSEIVREADALQYHVNQGPCVDAIRQGVPVQVADLGLDGRWPVWTRAVRQLNIASMMSVPLVSSGTVRGAIKIYCDMPGTFDERSEFLLGELAQTVAHLLEPAPSPAD